MLEWIYSPEAWLALATLTVLEIVLGIDNIIFISILTGRLPEEERARGRSLGLGLALITRLLLLGSLSMLMGLTDPLFSIGDHGVSGRDLILLFGGLFLLGKSTTEIHHSLEGADHTANVDGSATMMSVVIQIGLLDIVFSLDSVITALGLADHLPVMVLAIVIAMGVMLVAAKPIGDFVENHPTIKMLALSFLVLIGVVLIADAMHQHIPKGYVYFAMAFSFCVEGLNLRVRRASATPVNLHGRDNLSTREADALLDTALLESPPLDTIPADTAPTDTTPLDRP